MGNWKLRIAQGFRAVTIAALCGCTTIHPETISQTLGPNEQEKFQRDFAECHEFAESQRPKVSSKDIAVPLIVAFAFAILGGIIEYHNNANDWKPYYGGKVIV